MAGARFTVQPAEIPGILDGIDSLEDRGGPLLAHRFLVRIGSPRVELDLSWHEIGTLRLLLETAQDDLDRRAPVLGGPLNLAHLGPSMN